MSLSIHTMKALPDEGGWSVGYWLANQVYTDEDYGWIEVCQFKDIEDALRRVNILNGGNGIPTGQIVSVTREMVDAGAFKTLPGNPKPPWESEPE